jgi:hypothetical protein
MAFALPEYDNAFSLFVSEAMNELARVGDPLLEQIEVEERPGAPGSTFQDADGQDVDPEPGSVSADLVMDVNAVRDGDIDALVLQITLGANQLRDGLARILFGTLSTVTEATGNVVDAKGKPSFDSIYEMLDKIESGLTDDDKLSMPRSVMNPSDDEKLPELTEQQRAKLQRATRSKPRRAPC